MKKTLILLAFLATPYVLHADTSACRPGDLFDMVTGKPCVINTVPTYSTSDDKDATIRLLQNQIDRLERQIEKILKKLDMKIDKSEPVEIDPAEIRAAEKEKKMQEDKIKYCTIIYDRGNYSYDQYEEAQYQIKNKKIACNTGVSA